MAIENQYFEEWYRRCASDSCGIDPAALQRITVWDMCAVSRSHIEICDKKKKLSPPKHVIV